MYTKVSALAKYNTINHPADVSPAPSVGVY